MPSKETLVPTQREALERILSGATLGLEHFKERMGDRKAPTWFAVNVLQDNLAACIGTAEQALSLDQRDGQGVGDSLDASGVLEEAVAAWAEMQPMLHRRNHGWIISSVLPMDNAWMRLERAIKALAALSPPPRDASLQPTRGEGEREAIETVVLPIIVRNTPSVGKSCPAIAAEIADAILAIRPLPDTAGDEGERECKSVWRCAIGDVTGALDVLKNRWIGSRRKADREAGATLGALLDLIWTARDPAAANYNEAVANGKALIADARAALSPSERTEG